MRTVRTNLLVNSALLGCTAIAMLATSAARAQEPADAGDAGGSDIIVTGTRIATQKATAEKRIADNFVETLEANDVGKLPDQNVAEAIKRLPGLSVANDQGEGRYIIIRGIDPNLVNVTLNGQTLPAPEPTARQVKLDDIPSAMIQSITVTKSLLASQDANAIGGEVNIRTKTAFDERGAGFINARASGGYYSLNGKSPFELDATIGGRLTDTLGVVLSANYSRRPIESQNFQGTSAYPAGSVVPDTVGLRDYNLIRERMGVVGNIDFRPSDAVKLYLRSSYSRFSDNESRDQNLIDGITYNSAASTYTARGSVLMRKRKEEDNTKSVTLGGEFDVAGGKLEVSGGWTRAVKLDPLRSEFRFRSANNAVSGTYNLAGNGSTPYFSNFATNPALYTFNQLQIETRQAAETIWQGRVDYTLPVGLGDDSAIKVGVKYLDRHKTNNYDRTVYGAGAGSSAFTLARVAYTGNTDFYDGNYAFGPRIDYWGGRSVIDANPTYSSTAGASLTSSISASLSNDFDVKERIWAGYAMATLKFGTLTLIPGVRVEHTEDNLLGKVVNSASTLSTGFNNYGHNSYTDVFPGLNAKWEAIDKLIVRGGVTTAIGRPNYSFLVPSIVDNGATGGVQQITSGNPTLQPYKAVNFDAGIEYYPNSDSLFSAGFFHKEIDNPIYSATQLLVSPTIGNVSYTGNVALTRSINVDKGRITGIEVVAQTQFTSLPGVLSGFGISANFTHVWGNAKATGVRSNEANSTLPLFFQSKNSGNVQIFYEKYGIGARVAFNYRSSFLQALGTTAATDTYWDGNGQLDVHLSYQITPQVTVFGDASNLTDAPYRAYLGTSDRLIERERYGSLFKGGVQVHF